MPATPYLYGLALAAATNTGLPSLPSISTVALPGGGANVRVTFSAAHGLNTGQPVALSGTTGVTGLNATWTVQVISSTIVDLVGTAALTGTPAGTPVAAIPGLSIASTDLIGKVTIYAKGDGILALEDSVNAFSAVVQRWSGTINNEAQMVISPGEWGSFERFGEASAVLRARCIAGSFSHVSVFVE